MVPFVSQQLNNLDLALALAKRGNLPGAEGLVLQQFERLFGAGQYKEAAECAAESPQVGWAYYAVQQQQQQQQSAKGSGQQQLRQVHLHSGLLGGLPCLRVCVAPLSACPQAHTKVGFTCECCYQHI
jgi:hypothetical protein